MMFVEDVPMEEIQVTWMVNRIKNKLERRQASPPKKWYFIWHITANTISLIKK